MELINLDIAKELLYNDHDGIELMVYTKQLKEVDLSEFYELQSFKDLRKVCSRILKQVPNIHHIDFRINYEDTDWDQVLIYIN